MFTNDLVSQNISGHEPYIPGRQPKLNAETIKLNTNENPYPPSPLITDGLHEHIDNLRLYPDSSCEELRNSIALLHSVDPDEVIIGNGSDDILNLCTRCFSDVSKPIGFFEPSYSLYNVLGSLQGCPVKKIPFQDNTFEIKNDLVSKSKTNLFFITSPHAPTGRTYENSLFSSILKNYRGILVIDEAYADFASTNAINLLKESERLIITRTLSKSYSLAGLRVGYGLGSKKIISVLNRAREVYNVDRIAQYIAWVALNDRDYFSETKTKIINSREKLYSKFKEWGWDTYKSGANFLFTRPVDNNGNSGKDIAQSLFNFLQHHQIFTRYFPAHILTEPYLRISIGKEREMDMLVTKLIQWQTKDLQV